MNPGSSASKVAAAYIPNAVSIYKAQTQALIGLLGQIVLRDDIRSLVPLFYLTHETNGLGRMDYDSSSFQEVIEKIIDFTIENLRQIDDPLMTDPFTGKTSLTEEQIIEFAVIHRLGHENLSLYFKDGDIISQIDVEEMRKLNKITVGDRIITVKNILLNDSTTIFNFLSLPTLKQVGQC